MFLLHTTESNFELAYEAFPNWLLIAAQSAENLFV